MRARRERTPLGHGAGGVPRLLPIVVLAAWIGAPVCSVAYSGGPSPAGVQALQAGDRVTSQLGNQLSYRVALARGQYLRIRVTCETHFRIILKDPLGLKLIQTRLGPVREVPLSVISEVAGPHSIQVQPVSELSAGAVYTLVVRELRAAQPEDSLRLKAEALYVEAEQLAGEWTKKSVAAAIVRFEESGLVFRELGDIGAGSRAMVHMGLLQHQSGRGDAARSTLENGLKLGGQLQDGRIEAEVLSALVRVAGADGYVTEALDLGTRALVLAESLGDLTIEARALEDLGYAHRFRSQTEAVRILKEAIERWRKLRDRSGQAGALLQIGYAYAALGEEQAARESYEGALKLWESLEYLPGQADCLQALAPHFTRLGDTDKALDLLIRARSILRVVSKPKTEAAVLNGIGQIFFDGGKEEIAAGYFRQALELYKLLGLAGGRGATLIFLGLCQQALGEPGSALEYLNAALSLYRSLGDPRSEGIVLHYIGDTYLQMGEIDQAVPRFQQSLRLSRETGEGYSEVGTLVQLGVAYQRAGKYEQARNHYSQALSRCQKTGYRHWEAQAHYQMARLMSELKQLDEARHHFDIALELVESIRADFPGLGLRSSYFASTHHFFNFYVDLLMESHAQDPTVGHDASAFWASERARARSLLDSLTEAGVEIRQGADPRLLEQEKRLKQLLNSAAQRQAGATEGLEVIASEIRRLSAEYEQLQALIRVRNPRYAALTQPHVLILTEVQRELLDSDTVLLEYALGEEHSYLWAVSADSYDTYRLPARKRIEESALRLRELLTARETRPDETTRERRLRIREAGTRYWTEAAELSDILLGPVAATIENKRLLIVGDGALHYFPFASLPVPNRSLGDSPVPLVVEHELIRLPSASTLAVLREETAGREKAEKRLAVLADPVFEAHDPRFPQQPVSRGSQSLPNSDQAGPGAKPVSISYPRLPSSRIEAEAITRLAPAGRAMTAVGFDANRRLAISPELGQYQIVHFATHSILHQEHPELSGVVLSLFDEQGQPRQGLLRLHDIYNLRLPVELVVLSACESYLGKEVRGEGLLGIVRGFMYSGARRVIASLWKVDDLATKELMVRFYRNVFAKGESPAAALRHAQIEMWQQPDWRSPYYWAAFVLQGEWK